MGKFALMASSFATALSAVSTASFAPLGQRIQSRRKFALSESKVAVAEALQMLWMVLKKVFVISWV